MADKAIREQRIRFEDPVNVIAVDADGHPHVHVLRRLDDFVVHPQQVRAHEGAEPKVGELHVAVVNDGPVDDVLVLLRHLDELVRDQRHVPLGLGLNVRPGLIDVVAELLGRPLVQVRGDEPSRQDGVVWVVVDALRGDPRGLLVNFGRRHPVAQPGDDLLRHEHRQHLAAQVVAERRDLAGQLVERYPDPGAIALGDMHCAGRALAGKCRDLGRAKPCACITLISNPIKSGGKGVTFDDFLALGCRRVWVARH